MKKSFLTCFALAFLAVAFTPSAWAGCKTSDLKGTWNWVLINVPEAGNPYAASSTFKVDANGIVTTGGGVGTVYTVTRDCFVNATVTNSDSSISTVKSILSSDKRSWSGYWKHSGHGSRDFFTAYKN